MTSEGLTPQFPRVRRTSGLDFPESLGSISGVRELEQRLPGESLPDEFRPDLGKVEAGSSGSMFSWQVSSLPSGFSDGIMRQAESCSS